MRLIDRGGEKSRRRTKESAFDPKEFLRKRRRRARRHARTLGRRTDQGSHFTQLLYALAVTCSLQVQISKSFEFPRRPHKATDHTSFQLTHFISTLKFVRHINKECSPSLTSTTIFHFSRARFHRPSNNKFYILSSRISCLYFAMSVFMYAMLCNVARLVNSGSLALYRCHRYGLSYRWQTGQEQLESIGMP